MGSEHHVLHPCKAALGSWMGCCHTIVLWRSLSVHRCVSLAQVLDSIHAVDLWCILVSPTRYQTGRSMRCAVLHVQWHGFVDEDEWKCHTGVQCCFCCLVSC